MKILHSRTTIVVNLRQTRAWITNRNRIYSRRPQCKTTILGPNLSTCCPSIISSRKLSSNNLISKTMKRQTSSRLMLLTSANCRGRILCGYYRGRLKNYRNYKLWLRVALELFLKYLEVFLITFEKISSTKSWVRDKYLLLRLTYRRMEEIPKILTTQASFRTRRIVT
jgi:hypothetical protein